MLLIVLGLKDTNIDICRMEIKFNVGKRIRDLRELKEISQKELSFSAELDRSYIASVEKGRRNISIVNLEKIANALEVSLSDLFKGL